MSLNLQSSVGKIDIAPNTDDFELYQIYPAHPAYRYIWNICLSINAMTIAICSLKQLPVPDNGHLGITGKGFNYVVNLPGYDCVDLALSQIDPQCIPLRIDWGQRPNNHTNWAPQLHKWMDSIIWPGFVEIYEHNKTKIHRGNPQLAAMAKLFRDSFAHGLRVTRNKYESPVTWSGLTIFRDDHGKQLYDFIMWGDILLLAIWMCDSFIAH